MEKLRKHLDQAYRYISKIPVCEDAVDLMALARRELRAAYKEAENLTEQAKEGDTDGCEH